MDVTGYVWMRHGSFAGRCDARLTASPEAIAVKAAAWSRRLFTQVADFTAREHEEVLLAASLTPPTAKLIYAFELYGASFETVANLASSAAAEALAAITPDNREPMSRRCATLCESFLRAPLWGYTAKLAETAICAKTAALQPATPRDIDKILGWYYPHQTFVDGLSRNVWGRFFRDEVAAIKRDFDIVKERAKVFQVEQRPAVVVGSSPRRKVAAVKSSTGSRKVARAGGACGESETRRVRLLP